MSTNKKKQKSLNAIIMEALHSKEGYYLWDESSLDEEGVIALLVRKLGGHYVKTKPGWMAVVDKKTKFLEVQVQAAKSEILSLRKVVWALRQQHDGISRALGVLRDPSLTLLERVAQADELIRTASPNTAIKGRVNA